MPLKTTMGFPVGIARPDPKTIASRWPYPDYPPRSNQVPRWIESRIGFKLLPADAQVRVRESSIVAGSYPAIHALALAFIKVKRMLLDPVYDVVFSVPIGRC